MILDTALTYWSVVKRYNTNKRSSQPLANAAARDMRKMVSTSPAVMKRVVAFGVSHPLSTPPENPGPRFA